MSLRILQNILDSRIVLEIGPTLGSNFLIILISLITAVSAAHILGTEKRGELAFAVVFVSLISSLSEGGVNQAVPYFAGRHPEERGQILGTMTVMAVVQGVSAAILGWSYLIIIGQRDSSAAVFLVTIPFSLITTYVSSFFLGFAKLRVFNCLRIAQTSALLLGVILYVILGGITTAILLRYTALVIFCLCAWALLISDREIPIRSWQISPKMIKKLFSYGIKSYVGNVCWLINSRLDQLMMGIFLPFSALGIYSASVSYAGVIFSFFGAFAMITFARASSVPPKMSFQVISKYLRISLLLGIPTAVVMALIAPYLFPLAFGRDFREGVVPAIILTVASVILGINYIISNGLRVINYPQKPSLAEAIGLIVSVAGLYIVLPIWGIVGAAIVSLVSYSITMGVLIILAKTHEKTPPGDAEGDRR